MTASTGTEVSLQGDAVTLGSMGFALGTDGPELGPGASVEAEIVAAALAGAEPRLVDVLEGLRFAYSLGQTRETELAAMAREALRFDTTDQRIKAAVSRPDLGPILACDPFCPVRAAVAANPSVAAEVLDRLTGDEVGPVRRTALDNPATALASVLRAAGAATEDDAAWIIAILGKGRSAWDVARVLAVLRASPDAAVGERARAAQIDLTMHGRSYWYLGPAVRTRSTNIGPPLTLALRWRAARWWRKERRR